MSKQHYLLIAEKPDLMRKIKAVYETIESALPYSCDFTAQAGHLVALKMPNEIDPEKYGKWNLDQYPIVYPYRYKVMPDKTDLYSKIDTALKSGKYTGVIHAGDPDQEGELLVRLVLGMSRCSLPVKRFWTNDLSEASIEKALKNLREDAEFDPLFQAALIRQRTDYQFGMNLTGTVTKKMGDKCLLGRVKAPIIYILAKREAEIRNYVEKKTYKPAFTYQKCEFVYDKGFDTPELAMKENPNTDEATVVEYKSEKKTTKPPKLFKLSTLQVESFKVLKMTGSKTLEVLQSLYEKRLVSYPRTDCEFISTETKIGDIKTKVVSILSFNEALLTKNPDDVLKDKNYCNDKAISTEGHTAIIPTGEKPSDLTKDQKDLYELICRRFLAIFGTNKLTLHNTLTANPKGSTNPYVYKEKADLEPGFELIINEKYEVATSSGIAWSNGMLLKPIELKAKESVSQPPKRYNNGSLIKALDHPDNYEDDDGNKIKYAIGTPATRSNIIDQCIGNGYFEDKKGVYYATPKAEILVQNFENIPIFQPIESGKWESMLTKVRQKEAEPQKVQEYLIEEMIDSITKIKGMDVSPIKVSAKELGKCPHCGASVLSGKFGAYCEKKCGMMVSKAMGKDLTDAQVSSLLAGKKILLKGLWSKTKNKSYDAYLTPKGITESSYTRQDGTKATGFSWNFEMSFPDNKKKK